jgi:hypothetical protein
MMKGTHDSEASNREGIDIARSLLKGSGHSQGDLGCQTETERREYKEKPVKENRTR